MLFGLELWGLFMIVIATGKSKILPLILAKDVLTSVSTCCLENQSI